VRIRTTLLASVAATTLGVGLAAAPAQAADMANRNVHGQWCTSITEIGTKDTANAEGMTALTVRQYKAICDGAWKNFSTIYVWQQFHDLGYSYNASAGVAVAGESASRGWFTGSNRDREVFSHPTNTISLCTRGFGKIAYAKGGVTKESGAAYSSQVC
jgi:hypothetical protein